MGIILYALTMQDIPFVYANLDMHGMEHTVLRSVKVSSSFSCP